MRPCPSRERRARRSCPDPQSLARSAVRVEGPDVALRSAVRGLCPQLGKYDAAEDRSNATKPRLLQAKGAANSDLNVQGSIPRGGTRAALIKRARSERSTSMAFVPADRDAGRCLRRVDHWVDVERGEVAPGGGPHVEERRVVGLHELEAAVERVVVHDPALDVAEAGRQHAAALSG